MSKTSALFYIILVSFRPTAFGGAFDDIKQNASNMNGNSNDADVNLGRHGDGPNVVDTESVQAAEVKNEKEIMVFINGQPWQNPYGYQPHVSTPAPTPAPAPAPTAALSTSDIEFREEVLVS